MEEGVLNREENMVKKRASFVSALLNSALKSPTGCYGGERTKDARFFTMFSSLFKTPSSI
jgi:hypothetical protein